MRLGTVSQVSVCGAFSVARIHRSRNLGIKVGLSPLRTTAVFPLKAILLHLICNFGFDELEGLSA